MSQFSARHYNTIAKVLAGLHSSALDHGDLFLLETTEQFAQRLVDTFRRDNPRFNTLRFLAACKGQK